MSILLNSDYNFILALKIRYKIYLLRERDRKIVDKEFNKLHT